jgi:hypothetical protein
VPNLICFIIGTDMGLRDLLNMLRRRTMILLMRIMPRSVRSVEQNGMLC